MKAASLARATAMTLVIRHAGPAGRRFSASQTGSQRYPRKLFAACFVLSLMAAASAPLLGAEDKKASGEDLKNHLTHKDQNHDDALMKMESKYKGKKGKKSVNRRIRGWFYRPDDRCSLSAVSSLPSAKAAWATLACEVY